MAVPPRCDADAPGQQLDATMKLCKEEPRIVEALARRGIDNIDRVVMEPWPTGPTAK